MESKFLLQDLVQSLADKGYAKKQADSFVRSFFHQVEQAVFSGEQVKVAGLGTFKLSHIEARESVNVNTGEKIEIAGHHKFSFVPDAALKEAVNKEFANLDNVEVENPSAAPLFTVYDPEADQCAADVNPEEEINPEAIVSHETDANEVIEKKEYIQPMIEKKINIKPVILEIIAICVLLVFVVYVFINTKSRRANYTDSPEITVVGDSLAAEEPIMMAEDSVSESVPEAVVVNEDPAAWETLTTVTANRGDRLTLYSLKYYGDKIFWVYLFLANQDVLDNPNVLSPGIKIRIPKAPKAVVNAEDPLSIANARTLEVKLKRQYD